MASPSSFAFYIGLICLCLLHQSNSFKKTLRPTVPPKVPPKVRSTVGPTEPPDVGVTDVTDVGVTDVGVTDVGGTDVPTTCEPCLNNCEALEKMSSQMEEMMAAMDEMNKKLDEQASDMEAMMMELQNDGNETQPGKPTGEQPSYDTLMRMFSKEYKLISGIYGAELGPRDCSDVRLKGFNASGVYRVYPGNDDKRLAADVYCDFSVPKESWLVIQRRCDGSENFERTYIEYGNGFGNLKNEFWIGNEKLSTLTTSRKYKLRVELEDFEGGKRYAEYSKFYVEPAAQKYRLNIGGYSGNAGDSLQQHNGMEFTAKDYDNDKSSENCARQYRGAWWFNDCRSSNLNGRYLKGPQPPTSHGIEWCDWRGPNYSLKRTEMKITAI